MPEDDENVDLDFVQYVKNNLWMFKETLEQTLIVWEMQTQAEQELKRLLDSGWGQEDFRLAMQQLLEERSKL